jgi:hypothetical protein
MWGGYEGVIEDDLQDFSRPQDLLGLSTYLTSKDFYMNGNDLTSRIEKIEFIDENSDLWKKIDVWEESYKYFNWEKTHSVPYSGYLLNHTKKLAVDLANYYELSISFNNNRENYTIDAIPVLTETGGGTMMALNGASIESTENLIGT